MSPTPPTAFDEIQRLESTRMERSLIGAVLLDPSAAWPCVRHVPAEAFSEHRHKAIWRAMGELIERDGTTDAGVLAVHASRRCATGAVTLEDLVRCAEAAPSHVLAPAYARDVLHLWAARAAALVCADVIHQTTRTGPDAHTITDLIAHTGRRLSDLGAWLQRVAAGNGTP